MPDNKRKKATRFRAKTTHGYGSMKKNRGAGNRGGRGMAGSGKRADQKKPSILKKYGPSYFGKKGFNRPQSIVKKPIILNLSEIDKLAKKEGTNYIFDASKYDKILGTGKLTKKIKITSKSFSKAALEKIKEAGGEAVIC
jgi:large subunit ribosomal protein L15